MRKWEYRSQRWDDCIGSDGETMAEDLMSYELDSFGNDGWEMVSLV